MTDFLDAVKGSPLLLAVVVLVGAAVYAAEHFLALSGPITKLVNTWRNRELNRLRREALLRAEQRRIAAEEESTRVRDLTAEVERLRAEVDWLNGERADQRRRDAVRDRYDRDLSGYLYRLLATARAAGLTFVEPPDPPNLAPLHTDPDPGDRNPARA